MRVYTLLNLKTISLDVFFVNKINKNWGRSLLLLLRFVYETVQELRLAKLLVPVGDELAEELLAVAAAAAAAAAAFDP
jgi:hypothetical protein